MLSDRTRAPLGFIPTDWYPSALAVHGDDLIIATAKGEGSRANKDMGKTVYETKHKEHPYIPTLLKGSIARLNIPSTLAKLPEYTQMVEHDNLFHSDPGKITFAGGKNPIKHVIYVLKENRTYDQILGDLKVGDGDPSLTMYGEDITPNEHKLALQFGVLDNFYDSGEVSGDGHVWSNAAITVITTRRPGRLRTAAENAFTTSTVRMARSTCWTTGCPTWTIRPRGFCGTTSPGTGSHIVTTGNLFSPNGANRLGRPSLPRKERPLRRRPLA